MTDFRNKYAAHREPYTKPVPNFDIALNVVYYYDEWVRQVISPDVLDGPPLKAVTADLEDEIAPLIRQLFRTTAAVLKDAELKT